MGAAVSALSWELLARCGWLLRLAVGFLVLLCVIGLALPESWRSEELAGWLVAAVTIPVIAVVGSMVHAEGARLEDAGSLFPSRLYTLPVPTMVLVGPPLLLGTLTLVLCWLIFALCILRPWGAHVPLLWPGLVAAAVLASLQALVWFPFPLPWLRAPLLLIIAPGLINGSLILAQRGTSDGVIVGSLLAVLLAGYATALIGVTRSRYGSNASGSAFEFPSALVRDHKGTRPFSSPQEAQKWLEGRRLRWGFVVLTLCCLVCTPLFMWLSDFLVRDLNPEQMGDDLRELRQALMLFGRSWLVIAQLPVIPLLITGAVGGNSLGRLSTSVDIPACSPFLATRPMRTADMVAAKLLTCARAMIILWGLVFLMGLIWAVSMGRVGELAEHLLARSGSVAAALLALTAGLVLLPAISWLWLVSGMGVKIFRWPMLELVPAFQTLGVLILFGLLMEHKLEPWRPVLAGIALVALVCKALGVCWIVKRTRRARLVHHRTIVWAVTAWLVLAAAVLGIGAGLFGMGPLLLGVVVLMLPLARPLAAPLALAHHRTQ